MVRDLGLDPSDIKEEEEDRGPKLTPSNFDGAHIYLYRFLKLSPFKSVV